MPTRRLALPAAVLATLAVGATSALAAESVSVTSAKHKDGPYSGTFKQLHVEEDAKKTIYFKVKNKTDIDLEEMRFDDAATDNTPSGFVVKWFKGSEDITDEAQGDGFDFRLKAGKTKLFHATVKATAAGPTLCLGGQAGTPKLPAFDGAYWAVNDANCA